MDNLTLIKVFVLLVLLQSAQCQNFAGLLSMLSGGGLPPGFPNNAGKGGGGGGGGGGSGSCPYSPHPDRTKFYQSANARQMVQTCAPGTVYDHSKCACALKGQSSRAPMPGSNPRLTVQQPPAGMNKMMADFFRRMQGQSAQKSISRKPPPSLPVKQPTAPAIPAPIKPKSRSQNNQMEQMRQKMSGMSRDGNAAFPSPMPKTDKKKPKPKNKRKGKKKNGRKQKARKGNQAASFGINSNQMPHGPAYNPKPDGIPVYNPVQNTDKLPTAILKLSEPPKPPTTTPAPPPIPIIGLSAALPPSGGSSRKPGKKTKTKAEAIDTILDFLTTSNKANADPQAKPNPASNELMAMLSASQKPTPPAPKPVPVQNNPPSSSNGNSQQNQMPQMPGPQNNGPNNNDLFAMLSNQINAKPQGPPPPSGNDLFAMLSASLPNKPGGAPKPLPPAGNELLAMLTGSNPANNNQAAQAPSPNDLIAMLTGSKPGGSGPGAGPGPKDPFAELFGGARQPGSGRKFGGQAPSAGLNPFGGGGGMGNPFAGLGGAGPMAALGALGGGGGAGGMDALLAALGGGSGGAGGAGGLGGLGALAGLTGGPAAAGGAPPVDMTNQFNAQARLMPAGGIAGIGNVNYLLLNQLDRKGVIDMSDLTPGGLVAASNHFSRLGGMNAMSLLG